MSQDIINGFNLGYKVGDAWAGQEQRMADRKLARDQAAQQMAFTDQSMKIRDFKYQVAQNDFQQLLEQQERQKKLRMVDNITHSIQGLNSALNLGDVYSVSQYKANLQRYMQDPEIQQAFPFLQLDKWQMDIDLENYNQEQLDIKAAEFAGFKKLEYEHNTGQPMMDEMLMQQWYEQGKLGMVALRDTQTGETNFLPLQTFNNILFSQAGLATEYAEREVTRAAAALEALKKVSDINKTDSDRNINEVKAPGEIANTNADTLNKQANTKETLDENNRKEMIFRQNQSVANAINDYNANGDTRNQLRSQSVGDFAAYYMDVPKNSDGSDIVTPLNTAEVNAISLGFGLNSDGTHTKIENPQQLQFYIDRITGGDMKQLPRIYPQLKQMAARAKADGNEPVFNYISDLAKQFDKSATGEIIEKSQEASTVNKNAIYIANSVLSGNMPDGWTQFVGTKFWNDWLTMNGETARAWSQGRVNAENLKFIKAITIGDNKNIASLAKQMDTTTNWNSETHFLEDLLNSLDAVINNSKSIADIAPLGQSVNLINENKQTKKAFNDIAILRNLPLMLQRNPENTAIVQLNGQNLVTLENSFREKLKHQNIIITDGKTVTLYPRQYTDQGENLNKFIYSAKEYKETVEKNHKNSRGIFNRFTDAIGLTQ